MSLFCTPTRLKFESTVLPLHAQCAERADIEVANPISHFLDGKHHYTRGPYDKQCLVLCRKGVGNKTHR